MKSAKNLKVLDCESLKSMDGSNILKICTNGYEFRVWPLIPLLTDSEKCSLGIM